MGTTHAEWLNQNALRAYPFSENCQRRPSDGQGGLMPLDYAVPNYVLVDFVATMPDRLMSRLYMSQMTLAGKVLTMVFSTVGGSPVGAATSVLEGGMNVWTPFSGSGAYADVRGAVVVGDVERILSSVPDGIYVFGPDETLMEARCVRPSIAGVSSISVSGADGSLESVRLQGDVSLIAGENIRLRYDPPRNAIWIDADPNYGYSEKCECEDDRTCIKRINGVSSDNVEIVGGDCVKVTVSGGQVRIEDTCSKPCCGCEELTWLNSKSNDISTAIARLREFAEKLSDRMDSIVDIGAINGTLEDRDRFIPYHEVSPRYVSHSEANWEDGSPNWNIHSKNHHMKAHDDAVSARLLGQHVDDEPYYVEPQHPEG